MACLGVLIQALFVQCVFVFTRARVRERVCKRALSLLYVAFTIRTFQGNKKTPTEVGVFDVVVAINALRIEVPYVLCGDRISYVLLHGGHV